jgi:hypothetical protein
MLKSARRRGLTLLAGAAVALAATLLVPGLLVAAALGVSISAAAAGCQPHGRIPGLSAVQAADAETIVLTADRLSAEDGRVARIALMVAYDESTLIDLGPRSGNDGSLGLFQQRVVAGWGTAAEEMDPSEATAMFVRRLLAVPGWRGLPPWVAAQDVQRSAVADGANYARYWVPAGRWLAGVDVAATVADCGGAGTALPVGPVGRHGLPVGYTIPAGADRRERVALRYALSKLGDAYVWGATGPDEFDCSGLTMMAWAAAGVTLLHYTGDQLGEGRAATPATIAPGDLILVPGSDGTIAAPGHVGIYLGDALVESAVDPQQGVVVQSWADFTAGGLSGIRFVG